MAPGATLDDAVFIPLEPAAVKREKRENRKKAENSPAASRSPARDALDFARGRVNSHSIASRARPARTGALK
jgi:hypothetical protein